MTRRRSPMLAPITAAALVTAALALTGCGRNGPPELPSQQVESKPVANDLMPGANLPARPDTQPVKKKPKGNFILDPLL
ncbi:MAG: lipoprotein [Ancalomicrobiaceae bacterium]|nr:lipoprotein [Ancalomicrobiaceae bacterium]